MLNVSFVLVITLFLGVSSASGKKKHVVSVYYGTECVRCKNYFQTQILPKWKELKQKITLDLVPFGKSAQLFRDGRWLFECQHLQAECRSLQLHACVINLACGQTDTRKCSVEALDKVVYFFQCFFDRDPHPLCSQLVGFDYNKLNSCSEGAEGKSLMSQFGKRTKAFLPEFDYLPYVAVNGKHDTDAENDLLKRIKKL